MPTMPLSHRICDIPQSLVVGPVVLGCDGGSYVHHVAESGQASSSFPYGPHNQMCSAVDHDIFSTVGVGHRRFLATHSAADRNL